MNNQGISIPFWLKNYTPVLDYLSYTTNLSSAWSTQRVVIDGYAGSLIRLRRSSDNAESDFGWNAGTGDIDNTAIDAWGGVDTLYYTKIYDQQGTNHYIQTTTTLQPTRSSNRAFSNNDKMMVMTNTFSTQYYHMIERSQATGTTAADRINSGDTTISLPYYGLMNSFGPAYCNHYLGDGSGNRYLIQHLVTHPIDMINSHAVSGNINTNTLSVNGTIQNDNAPIVYGTPTATTYHKNVNASWFYKTGTYANSFKGYIDERYLYSQLLNNTNLGTVRTYINDKYSVY